MYSLLTEFRDGDNVTTMLEHNSNFVPWHALCHEILPRLGRRVECQLARFDPATGRLDPDHPASLVDARTRLVCCTGASNFFGTKPDLVAVRQIARAKGALFLVDGAQLLPSSAVDVQALDVDCLAFSVHKLLGPSASVPCTPKSTCCEMHDLSTARGRVEITHHTPDPISVPNASGSRSDSTATSSRQFSWVYRNRYRARRLVSDVARMTPLIRGAQRGIPADIRLAAMAGSGMNEPLEH